MPVIDEKLLREPNLLTPNVQPIGPVKVDNDHPIVQRNELVSFYIFGSRSIVAGVNALAADWHVYDCVQERIVNLQGDYTNYFTGHQVDELGGTVTSSNTTSSAALITAADYQGEYGWEKIYENQSYTLLCALKREQNEAGLANWIYDGSSRHLVYQTVAYSDTNQTIRCINKALWSASYDETFTVDMPKHNRNLFVGCAWNGSSGRRTVFFGDQEKSRTNFTGSISSTGKWSFLDQGSIGGSHQSARYLMVFANDISSEDAKSLRLDPYQILKPA